MLAKLDHHGIRGTSNDWFKSYLSNRNQYVFINGYDSGLAGTNCDIPQRSVPGPFLFLLYMNNLNQAIKFCKVQTETIIELNWSKKKFEGDLKVKLYGKRLYPIESVKYLGVKIDATFCWQYNVNDISIKLNRAIMLFFLNEEVS